MICYMIHPAPSHVRWLAKWFFGGANETMTVVEPLYSLVTVFQLASNLSCCFPSSNKMRFGQVRKVTSTSAAPLPRVPPLPSDRSEAESQFALVKHYSSTTQDKLSGGNIDNDLMTQSLVNRV